MLVERDIDSWYESFDRGVIQSITNPIIRVATWISPNYMGMMRKGQEGSWIAWQGWKIERKDMRAKAKQAYIDHYVHVRRITPPERLLEFSLEDGWEPLCRFLNKPIPSQPFPHVNDSEALQEKIWIMTRRGVVSSLTKPVVWMPVVVAIGCVVLGTYTRNF